MYQRSIVVETRRLPAVDTRPPDGFHLPIDFPEACPVETAPQPFPSHLLEALLLSRTSRKASWDIRKGTAGACRGERRSGISYLSLAWQEWREHAVNAECVNSPLMLPVVHRMPQANNVWL